jgi:hypothetical protein
MALSQADDRPALGDANPVVAVYQESQNLVELARSESFPLPDSVRLPPFEGKSKFFFSRRILWPFFHVTLNTDRKCASQV